MTRLEEALSRPEFDSFALDITTNEAHDRITNVIRGLSTSESEEGRKYRTADGKLVAILESRSSTAGDETAAVAYRTAPPSELPTRKASKIEAALEPSAIDR